MQRSKEEKMTEKSFNFLAHFEREIYFYNTFMTNKKEIFG
jgi:hypothetical protein